mgnify:CR=1 FL=1
MIHFFENVLSVVNNNRNELSGIEENSTEESADTDASNETDSQSDDEE